MFLYLTGRGESVGTGAGGYPVPRFGCAAEPGGGVLFFFLRSLP
jgi:hypothetical protein